MCFWDSLEHIYRPDSYLNAVSTHGKIFLSLPTFEGPTEVLKSKHWKPKEHYHYFTPQGLILYLMKRGFHMLHCSHMEVQLGREGITTFVFERL
jgi:hypothetical protein